MKKSLIKTLVMLFGLCLESFASSYEWSSEISKTAAFKNEAIYLKYLCRFDDRAEFYAVEFSPMQEDANLSLEVLSETSRLEDGRRVLEYEFVLFFHRAGEKKIAFEALMKKTTKESVENTVIGRDNGKYAEYETTKVALPKHNLTVFDTNSSLVGSLSLEVKKDTPTIKAMMPYHLELRFHGEGNLKDIEAIDFKIEGVKVFAQQPTHKLLLTKDGYQGEWSQKFAFVSPESFRIEGFDLEYLNPKTQQSEKLHFKSIDVEVTQGYTDEELLDLPEEKSTLFEREMLYYVLAFLAGFLVSRLKFRLRLKKERSPFCKRVDALTSLEALSILLILEDAQKYAAIVEKIESQEITSLAKAKRLICR